MVARMGLRELVDEVPNWLAVQGFPPDTFFHDGAGDMYMVRDAHAHVRPLSDGDVRRVWDGMGGSRRATLGDVRGAIHLVARSNPRDLMAEAYDGLPQWDGVGRSSELLHVLAGAVDDELSRCVSDVWLESTVQRAMSPGCDSDYGLMLVGHDVVRCTDFLRALRVGDDSLVEVLPWSPTRSYLTAVELGRNVMIVSNLPKVTGETAAVRFCHFVSRCEDRYLPVTRSGHPCIDRRFVVAGVLPPGCYLETSKHNRRLMKIRPDFRSAGIRYDSREGREYVRQAFAEVVCRWRSHIVDGTEWHPYPDRDLEQFIATL